MQIKLYRMFQKFTGEERIIVRGQLTASLEYRLSPWKLTSLSILTKYFSNQSHLQSLTVPLLLFLETCIRAIL